MVVLNLFISIFTVLTWASVAFLTLRANTVAPVLSDEERRAGRALLLVMMALAGGLVAIARMS